MNPRLLIAFSMALNAALAAAIFVAAKPTPVTPVFAPVAVVPAAEIQPPAPPSAAAARPPGLPFRWDAVAVADLKLYRENLRAVGCPEITVREIIRAVINESFGTRRRDILEAFQNKYWDLVLGEELNGRQTLPQTEWGRALTALTAERQQLLTDVLGPDALISDVSRQSRRTETEQRCAWLPPAKRTALLALEEKHQQQLDDWTAGLGMRVDGAPTPEDDGRLQQLQKEFDEAEKQLLTPDELAELKLRESDVADWAASLPGFNPTEDEWRSLTRLRVQFEAAQNALPTDLADDERAARQNELQSNFDNAVKAALEPDRVAQYQLANNDQYQSLHNVTERYGLPDNVVAQALDLQQIALAQAAQLRANTSLSPADRLATLGAIQQETERTLQQILGAKVLATYREYGADWIGGLGQPDMP